MKRHPVLRQLSSDHHTGLVVARKARQAAQGSAGDRSRGWSDLVVRFHAELEPHFQAEEAGLLVALRQAGETALVERTLGEHEEMRSLVAQDRPEYLARFAELLTAHIRFEERELFHRAQEVLEPDELAGLDTA